MTDLRPAGIWRESYRLPDGSVPVVVTDADGTLRAFYIMRPHEDEREVRRYLETLAASEESPRLTLLS